MQEMDNVQVIVEKEKYARDGVHKGMFGWICHPKCVEGYWLVNFPQCGEKEDVAEISIKEEDLKLVKILDVKTNEQIKEQFDNTNETTKGFTGQSDDISGYMI